jgi:protein KRI1
VTLKQQNISAILDPKSRSVSPRLPTHVEEQEALRSETISAFHKSVAANDRESDSDDGLLVLREKTTDENEREEEEYKEFLEREVGNVKELLWVEPKSETVANGVTPEDSVGEGSKQKKKKKKGAEKAKNEQSDQDFLIK